jgi:hypothetical protein
MSTGATDLNIMSLLPQSYCGCEPTNATSRNDDLQSLGYGDCLVIIAIDDVAVATGVAAVHLRGSAYPNPVVQGEKRSNALYEWQSRSLFTCKCGRWRYTIERSS